jgi:hypothetical protein
VAALTLLLAGCSAEENAQNDKQTAIEPGGEAAGVSSLSVKQLLDKMSSAGVACTDIQVGVSVLASLPGARCSLSGQPATVVVIADAPTRDRFVTAIAGGVSKRVSDNDAHVVVGEDFAVGVNSVGAADKVKQALGGQVHRGAFIVR